MSQLDRESLYDETYVLYSDTASPTTVAAPAPDEQQSAPPRRRRSRPENARGCPQLNMVVLSDSGAEFIADSVDPTPRMYLSHSFGTNGSKTVSNSQITSK